MSNRYREVGVGCRSVEMVNGTNLPRHAYSGVRFGDSRVLSQTTWRAQVKGSMRVQERKYEIQGWTQSG
jgi:hypothetical protein